jgi:predicted transcriptional regulator
MVSIHPRHVEAIASGRKTIELRRRFPKTGGRLVIYATLPEGAVVGLARIAQIEHAEVDAIWGRHQASIGIGQAEFRQYFGEAKQGVAIGLSEFQPFSMPVKLAVMRSNWPGFQPPQSFRFWTATELARLVELGGTER